MLSAILQGTSFEVDCSSLAAEDSYAEPKWSTELSDLYLFNDDRIRRGLNHRHAVLLLNPGHTMPQDAVEERDIGAGSLAHSHYVTNSEFGARIDESIETRHEISEVGKNCFSNMLRSVSTTNDWGKRSCSMRKFPSVHAINAACSDGLRLAGIENDRPLPAVARGCRHREDESRRRIIGQDGEERPPRLRMGQPGRRQ